LVHLFWQYMLKSFLCAFLFGKWCFLSVLASTATFQQ
jgi:hypothetical protein